MAAKDNGKRAGGCEVLGALLVLAAGSASAAPAETVLYSFCHPLRCTDGERPFAGLIADSKGNLYGTTSGGGASGNGAVFKLSSSGSYTVLHSLNLSRGANPYAGLIADSKGNLYGTALEGGASNGGVLFKLSESGTYTVLHYFHRGDGAGPLADLYADSSGNLYGTTSAGGASNLGTVFKLSPSESYTSESYTVLHSFSRGDGWQPWAGLIADSKGNLYGTTYGGGKAGCGAYACGVVFKLSPDGRYTLLHAFTGGNGGANPIGGLYVDSKGNLYGTTYYGGASNLGTVFRLSSGGHYTVLHSFSGGDGANPTASLIADSKGNFYGTTANGGGGGCFGGPGGCGVVFQLSPGGTLTVLHSFSGGSDGSYPGAGVIADSSGIFYGTTEHGGSASENGTVFKLTGTGFVPEVPASP